MWKAKYIREGERKRYTQLNAAFQRIATRTRNNRINRKDFDFFKKLEISKGMFYSRDRC